MVFLFTVYFTLPKSAISRISYLCAINLNISIFRTVTIWICQCWRPGPAGEAGITFVGLPPSAPRWLAAKATAIACPPSRLHGPLKDADEAVEKAVFYGFPIILKAAAAAAAGACRAATSGGGHPAFQLVKSEAKKAFGNEDIFIEKFLVEPKHIEVQILGDKHGNVFHLGERDCSLQRRYQKVVEFAPAWSVPRPPRRSPSRGRGQDRKHVGYINAGTVEFLVDKRGNHYFIEMNPRIQVEHTVTEMVTGIDLVRAQILIAEGLPPVPPPDRHPQPGRPAHQRLRHPVPGHHRGPGQQLRPRHRQNHRLPLRRRLRRPSGRRQRLTGAVISPYYDSLLVKVTSWDNTFEGLPQGHPRHQRGARPRRQDQHSLCHQHSGPPHLPRGQVPHQVHRRDP